MIKVVIASSISLLPIWDIYMPSRWMINLISWLIVQQHWYVNCHTYYPFARSSLRINETYTLSVEWGWSIMSCISSSPITPVSRSPFLSNWKSFLLVVGVSENVYTLSSSDERLCEQSRELERFVPAHNFEGHRIMIDIALMQQPSNDIMPRTLLYDVLSVDYANHFFWMPCRC